MDENQFAELISSIKEAGKIRRGELTTARIWQVEEPDVKAIREKLGVSQTMFAMLIGVSIRTIQNWEQGHRHPTGPAKVLLRLVADDPAAVFKGLRTCRR